MYKKTYKFDESKIYYVYEWFNVDTGYIFYVGKGCKDRYQEKSSSDRSKYFMEYYNNNKCDKRKVYENLDEKTACDLEDARIKKLKSEGQCCANILNGTSHGGRLYGKDNGFYGKKFSPEVIERLRAINSDGRNKGENNSQYGISPKDRMDAETYAGWRKKQQENKVMERNPRAEPIILVEGDNNKEFNCITACAIYIKNILNLDGSIEAIRSRLSEGLRTGLSYMGMQVFYKNTQNKKQLKKKTIYMDNDLLSDLNNAAKELNTSSNKIISDLLKDLMEKGGNSLKDLMEKGGNKQYQKTRNKTLRIEREIIEAVENISKEEGITFSKLVSKLVSQFLLNIKNGGK